MDLAFCPQCRYPALPGEACPSCGQPCEDDAENYIERLLQTILSEDTSRAGMAVDVLTKWLREPRAFVPLTILLAGQEDPYRLVLSARGLGWLRQAQAVPHLSHLLQDQDKPFVARIAAAKALGRIGGQEALQALQSAARDKRPSVAEAAIRILEQIENQEMVSLT